MTTEILITPGTDLTSLLQITKYEPPVTFEVGQSKGNFPTDKVAKTDETRIQSALKCIDELWGKPYYISVKIDGTSSTFLYVNDEFTVCSREQSRKEDENCVYWRMARKYDLANKLADYKHLCVQGEIAGPGIQKNKLGLTDHELFVFNIYDTVAQKYLDFNDFVAMCEKLGLSTVPILEVGDSFEYRFEELLAKAEGKYPFSGREREGIVIRSQVEMWSEKLRGRLSFKCISNTFLLKEDDKEPESLTPEQIKEKKIRQGEKDLRRLGKENKWLRGQLGLEIIETDFTQANNMDDTIAMYDSRIEKLLAENTDFKLQLGIEQIDPREIYKK